ncbi:hypothetical protein Hanom_Chr04g00301341 [Helianthus anomalus]
MEYDWAIQRLTTLIISHAIVDNVRQSNSTLSILIGPINIVILNMHMYCLKGPKTQITLIGPPMLVDLINCISFMITCSRF